MRSHNSCSVRRNWKSSFEREAKILFFFLGNFWILIRLWSPLMIIICFVLDTLSRRAYLVQWKLSLGRCADRKNMINDGWGIMVSGSHFLGHLQITPDEHSPENKKRKKSRQNKSHLELKKEIKVNCGPFNVSPHLFCLRLVFGRGWCLNPRHRSIWNWFPNPHQVAGWSGFGLTLKIHRACAIKRLKIDETIPEIWECKILSWKAFRSKSWNLF